MYVCWYVCMYVLTHTNQRDWGLAGLGGGEVKKEKAGEKGEKEKGDGEIEMQREKEQRTRVYIEPQIGRPGVSPEGGKRANIHLR